MGLERAAQQLACSVSSGQVDHLSEVIHGTPAALLGNF
jgi:hypothetical protein